MTEDEIHEVVSRMGTAAMLYYPEIHIDDEEYKLLEQADWCLEPIDHGVSGDGRTALRELVARTIVAPTSHREESVSVLMGLIPEG